MVEKNEVMSYPSSQSVVLISEEEISSFCNVFGCSREIFTVSWWPELDSTSKLGESNCVGGKVRFVVDTLSSYLCTRLSQRETFPARTSDVPSLLVKNSEAEGGCGMSVFGSYCNRGTG